MILLKVVYASIAPLFQGWFWPLRIASPKYHGEATIGTRDYD